jgi:hypothetical protein
MKSSVGNSDHFCGALLGHRGCAQENQKHICCLVPFCILHCTKKKYFSVFLSCLRISSGFRREVDKYCVLLGYYATSSGNLLPTCEDKIIANKIGPIRRPETSIKKNTTTRCVIIQNSPFLVSPYCTVTFGLAFRQYF